ncbi:TonB-dependent receptor [Porticoccaceae bacterium]|nr:TonB-dependent receptor [Porticoccaceae bacterium]
MKIKANAAAAISLAALLTHTSTFSQSPDAMEEILVSGSLTPVSLLKSANAVTVIDRQTLKNRAASTLSEIMRDVPGFSVSQVGVLGSQTQIRVRGSEANHLLVIIDGVEANDPSQSDEFSWGTMSAADIERIEIIRGPQSSIRGSDAVAGVVNIITRRADRSGFGVHADVGSWSTRNTGFNAGYQRDGFDFRLGANHVKSDGANIARQGQEDDGYKNTTFNLTTGLKMSDQFNMSLAARQSDGTNQFDADADFDGIVEDQDRQSDFKNTTLRLEGNYSSADGNWQHKVAISRAKNDNTAFADGVMGNRTASTKDQYQFIGNMILAGGDQTLSLLAEREEEDWMQRGEISWGIYDPNQDRERDTDSLAIEYRTFLTETLTLAASGRYDDNSEFDSAKTYRVEAVYQLSDQTRLRSVFGTAVKNPTFTERYGFYTNFIGNPDLVPEESQSWEIGIDQTLKGSDFTVSLTVFEADLTNEIDGFVYDPATFAYTSDNMTSDSERNGVEISAMGNITDSLGLTAAYTYTDSSDPDGTREVRRPRHTASANLAWQVRSNLQLNTNIQFTGDQTDVYFPPFPEPSQVVVMDSHTLVNLTLNYQASKDLDLYLKVENTLDEEYEEVFGYQTLGRGTTIGMRYDF